jgi:hypothetical protein
MKLITNTPIFGKLIIERIWRRGNISFTLGLKYYNCKNIVLLKYTHLDPIMFQQLIFTVCI